MLLAGLFCLLFLFSACSQDHSTSYKKALKAFGEGDYETAARSFERLGDYSDAGTYAAYSRGLVLFEQGSYSEAEPYFEKTQDFMYGKSRYTFCHAYTLETAGNYQEAAELFLSLGDFEDASRHGNYCKARNAEQNFDYDTALFGYAEAEGYGDTATRLDSLQVEIYSKAEQLKKDKQYEQALNLFTKLGDYFDSPAQAKECKDYFRNQMYESAEAMEREGRLQEAYEAFMALTGYSDAETRAEELAVKLGIPTKADGEE